MQTRLLGTTATSVIGFGTMSWPGCHFGTKGYAPTPEERASVREMVIAALDAGITLIDTAEGYGRGLAEELLGDVLAESGRRAEAVIVTKVGPTFETDPVNGRNCDLSEANIFQRCEASLRRLRTDTIDLYLAHWPDPITPIEETMAAAAKLKAQGKIREFGVSNFSAELMAEALKYGPLAANQLPYSLVDRDIDADRRPFCEKHDIGIMAYSPMGKGVLSGKYDATHLPPGDDYRHQRKHFAKENLPRHLAIAQRLRELAPTLNATPSQLALAWVLAQPGLTVALPGARSPEQIRANAAAGDIVLPEAILAELNALSLPL